MYDKINESYMWLDLRKPRSNRPWQEIWFYHTNTELHYQISLPQTTTVKGSAFSIAAFFKHCGEPYEQSVSGLDWALANKEMAVRGCTAPWCWIMTCALKFILSPEWLLTWLNSSIQISHKKICTPSCPPSRPPLSTPIGAHLIQSTSAKNDLKWWET